MDDFSDLNDWNEWGSTDGIDSIAESVVPNDGPAGPDMPSISWSDIKDGASSMLNKGMDLLNPSNARLSIAGLAKGGLNSLLGGTSRNMTAGFASKGNKMGMAMAGTPVSWTEDWRVAISLPSGAGYFWRNGSNSILSPLVETDGVIFPYTPQISVSHVARYGETKLTHSNYSSFFYEGSEISAITITGDFTVQTPKEGRYLLAAIYFFRAATKMFFGNDQEAGTPPPLVTLDGYGSHYFPGVNCVMTQFQHTLPQDVDYIEVPTGLNGREPGAGNYVQSTRLPTVSQISVTLQPVYSRNQVAQFSLNKFASGGLLKRGGFI